MNSHHSWRTVYLGQDGIVLPLVLVFLALGLLLITPTLGHGYSALAGTTVMENRAEELHAADSGIEEAIYWITRHQPGDEYEWNATNERWERRNPYSLNSKLVHVTIKPETAEGEHLYRIVSRAEDPNGSGSTVLAFVFAMPFAEILDGDQSIGNQDPVPTNDIVVNGALNVNQYATIPINVYLTGDLTLENNSTMTGTITAEGDVTLAQNATITTSQICVGGDLTLGNNSKLNADVVLTNPDGASLRLTQAGAQITGDVFAYGDLSIFIANNASIVGNLYCWGDVHLRLDGPNSSISGTIYRCEGNAFTYQKHQQATLPNAVACEDECQCLLTPSEDCPNFPTNEAQIWDWEII